MLVSHIPDEDLNRGMFPSCNVREDIRSNMIRARQTHSKEDCHHSTHVIVAAVGVYTLLRCPNPLDNSGTFRANTHTTEELKCIDAYTRHQDCCYTAAATPVLDPSTYVVGSDFSRAWRSIKCVGRQGSCVYGVYCLGAISCGIALPLSPPPRDLVCFIAEDLHSDHCMTHTE